MKRKRGGKESTDALIDDVASETTYDSQTGGHIDDDVAVKTPTKRARVPKQSGKLPHLSDGQQASAPKTPKGRKRAVTVTPSRPSARSKAVNEVPVASGPSQGMAADRSARRKTSRRLIERAMEDEQSNNDMSDSDAEIANQLLGSDGSDTDEQEVLQNGHDENLHEPETPSKPRRGRPKGRSRKRSPTPPHNLPAHEQYFWQNRPGGNKTSNNVFPPNALLNHSEYLGQIQAFEDPHQEQRDFLLSLHARSYSQWTFELENGFNICLFGYGSKRQLLADLASYVHGKTEHPPKTLVVNGYIPDITVRDILSLVASTLLPSHLQLPVQPQALLDVILEALNTRTDASSILLLINSIDAPSLRRPATQSFLAALASHPRVSLVATADTPNFPLLWDTSLRSTFRFLFHDCTTFAPYTAELQVVDNVDELLGRSGRKGIGGKDGVAFVLRSLPANARSLFRILVAEQVAASMDEYDDGQATAGADVDGDEGAAPERHAMTAEGVEYRLLYRKSCEELICTNENGFRTLLKEFFDHQMVESRRDALGTEKLVVPFRREELEGLLEELVD